MNKSAMDEHLTRHLYTRSEKTLLVHDFILRNLADEGAWSSLNRWDSSIVD